MLKSDYENLEPKYLIKSAHHLPDKTVEAGALLDKLHKPTHGVEPTLPSSVLLGIASSDYAECSDKWAWLPAPSLAECLLGGTPDVCDYLWATRSRIMAHTVLVVDDDPLTQRVLQHYLDRAGYQMLSATSGSDAIKLARSELPQLIILDVMMPDMDGWTVLKRIKKAEATKAIPVILLSANAELMAKEESLRSGATFLLVKPISAEQLLSLVRRLVPGPELHGTSDKTRN